MALTARASDERYAVLDVFEIDGNPVKDHATYDAVADLAERSDVRALLISQGLNYQRIRQIAVDMHMTVVNVSRPYWVGTTPVR